MSQITLTSNGRRDHLHEETASVLRGRLVAKTPDDPVIVVSMRKVSKRNIEFVDGCESCEPEQWFLP